MLLYIYNPQSMIPSNFLQKLTAIHIFVEMTQLKSTLPFMYKTKPSAT